MPLTSFFERTDDYFPRGLDINILTVDNHADGVYLYLKLIEKQPGAGRRSTASAVVERRRGQFNGCGIGNIDFFGNVHPDQFWQDYTFGNIRERGFGDIWLDESDPLMHGLKHKAAYIKGRCRLCRTATCAPAPCACGASERMAISGRLTLSAI